MASPIPKPTALVKLHGSPSHAHKANRRAPEPPGPINPVTSNETAPPELTPSQRAEWEFTLTHAPREMLRKIDRTLLASWCIAADTARIAGIELGKHGPFHKHKTRGVIIASAFRVHQMATLQLIRLAEQMGFSPTARARIFKDGWEALPQGKPLKQLSGDTLSLAEFIARRPVTRK